MRKNVVLSQDWGDKEQSRHSTGRAAQLNLVGAISTILCFLLGSSSVFGDQVADPLVVDYTSGTYQYRLAVQGDRAWIGTEGGLVLTKGDTGQRLKFTPADWRGAPGAGSVVIDASGSIWACPSDEHGHFDPGLFQFDGLEWEWKDQPLEGAMYGGLVQTQLASDDLGNVWVPLSGRMIRFHGSDWYSWDVAPSPPSWWPVLSRVAARGGKAWAWAQSSNPRLFIFEDDDLSWVTLGESILDSAADLTSGVWLAVTGRVLCFNEGTFRSFELPPESGLSDKGFNLRVDGRNTKWCIRGVDYELRVASLSEDETWGVYGDFPVPVEWVQDVRFGEDGQVWLMPRKTIWYDPLGIDPPRVEPSLLRYGARGLQSFWASDPLPATSVSDLCIDSGGAVWVAGGWTDFSHDPPDASYLCRWEGADHEIFWPWHRELPNLINCVTPGPNGDVWFGMDEGLYVFDGEQWHCHSEASVTKVKIAPDGDVWVIWVVSEYARRAQRFDGTTWWNAYRPDWSAQELSDVAFDSNGVVWFSCDDQIWDNYEDPTPDDYGGIRSLGGGTEGKYLTGHGYDAIAVDPNDVVWATYGRLARIENGRAEIVPLEQLGNCYTIGPLLIDSQGRKWCHAHHSLGGYEYEPGLVRIDENEDVRFYSNSDGLCSGEINDIDEDLYGNIWVSTGRGISVLLEESSFDLGGGILVDESIPPNLSASLSLSYVGPATNADLYVALQAPSGQIFYVAPQDAEPAFPIFYAAFEGSTEFLQPGPDYDGPGSIPNTPDMKDLAPPPLPLPDPTGLALFGYPVPYFANVPLPAYSAIDDLVLLNTAMPGNAPTGTYTFHIGITAPSSISNLYRTAQTTFEVTAD